MDLEIKVEPEEEVLVKTEPPEEISPEFVPVDVSEQMSSSHIKQEETTQIITKLRPGLKFVKLSSLKIQPKSNQQITAPIKILTKPRVLKTFKTFERTDFSAFWKPFQPDARLAQQQPQIQLQTVSNCIKHKNIHNNKFLLQEICSGKHQLTLPEGFKMYFIKDDEKNHKITLLITQMMVEDGLPVMKRQIVINNDLDYFLYFNSRRITNIDLAKKSILSVRCIQSLAEQLAIFNFCKGLSSIVRMERWPTMTKMDRFENKETLRHKECRIVHRGDVDQCINCKFLEVRNKKAALAKKYGYMTTSMLLNYKYWRSMKLGVAKLKRKVRKLQREKVYLRRKLKNFERKEGEFLMDNNVVNIE